MNAINTLRGHIAVLQLCITARGRRPPLPAEVHIFYWQFGSGGTLQATLLTSSGQLIAAEWGEPPDLVTALPPTQLMKKTDALRGPAHF
jgi:hypothetical protein